MLGLQSGLMGVSQARYQVREQIVVAHEKFLRATREPIYDDPLSPLPLRKIVRCFSHLPTTRNCPLTYGCNALGLHLGGTEFALRSSPQLS